MWVVLLLLVLAFPAICFAAGVFVFLLAKGVLLWAWVWEWMDRKDPDRPVPTPPSPPSPPERFIPATFVPKAPPAVVADAREPSRFIRGTFVPKAQPGTVEGDVLRFLHKVRNGRGY